MELAPIAEPKPVMRLGRDEYEGLHRRYAAWLGNPQQPLMLSKGREEQIRKELSSLFDGMMQTLYSIKGSEFRIEVLAKPKVQKFINAHAGVLDSGFRQVKMSDTMRRHLTRSDYIFSGIKTFHELNEAFPSLLDENGNRKPFERFLNDVRKIDSTYNSNYLRAEYNFVQSSAEMASKWEQFLEDGDRYNLQYRTAHDGKVRPAHTALHGVTLPLSDPFWEEYYPPNGWNCRCTVVQVRKSKYPQTPHDEAMALGEEALQRDSKGIFHFNAGKEQKTVPDYNPYTIRRCRDCDIAKGNTKLARQIVPDNELCAACKLLRSCEQQRAEIIRHGKGIIEISNMVNRSDNDFTRLMQVAEFFAGQGKKVVLTPKMTRPPKFDYDCVYGALKGTPFYGKCPDLNVDGAWYEHEGFVTANPKRAFSNMINDGMKQSDRLILDKPELTDAYMKRVITQRLRDGHKITEVWLKEGEELRLLYKKSEE